MRARLGTALALLCLPAGALAAVTPVSVDEAGAPLAAAGTLEHSVALAADGDVVAFGVAGRRDRVYVRDLGTGETERVGGRFAVAGPQLSADGRFLAYAEREDRLRLRDRRRDRTVKVRTDRGAGDTVLDSFALAANGRSLVYATYRFAGRGQAIDPVEYAVYRYDVRTRATRRLTPLIIDATDVAVSGNGRVVAFASEGYTARYGDERAKRGLLALDVRTGAVRRVEGGGTDPALSGDGRYVVSVRTVGRPDPETLESDERIAVSDRRAGTTRLVGSTQGGEPAISGDGDTIAFGVSEDGRERGPAGDVYVGDRASGPFQRVTDDGESSFPALSRDGTVLAYGAGGSVLVRAP